MNLQRAFFVANLGYMAGLAVCVLAGYTRAWVIGVALYAGLFLALFVFYWLPGHSRARRSFGKPVPPWKLNQLLGFSREEVSQILEGLSPQRTQRSRSGITFDLYEILLRTDDGLWRYWIETNQGRIVASDVEFESAKSRFLNYSAGKSHGTTCFLSRND